MPSNTTTNLRHQAPSPMTTLSEDFEAISLDDPAGVDDWELIHNHGINSEPYHWVVRVSSENPINQPLPNQSNPSTRRSAPLISLSFCPINSNVKPFAQDPIISFNDCGTMSGLFNCIQRMLVDHSSNRFAFVPSTEDIWRIEAHTPRHLNAKRMPSWIGKMGVTGASEEAWAMQPVRGRCSGRTGQYRGMFLDKMWEINSELGNIEKDFEKRTQPNGVSGLVIGAIKVHY